MNPEEIEVRDTIVPVDDRNNFGLLNEIINNRKKNYSTLNEFVKNLTQGINIILSGEGS